MAIGDRPILPVLFGDLRRQIALLRITVAAAFFCSLGLSWKLWIASRSFPLSPVSRQLPDVAWPLDYLWFFCVAGLLLAIVLVDRPRRLVLIFLALAGLLSLWDQNRWQPWFYQYFFLLAALGVYASQDPPAEKQRAALDVCRLVLVGTYFWSGMQKLNANFVRETWPGLAGGMLRRLPDAAKELPPFLILLIPLLEIAIAMGLLTRKFRRHAIVVAVATHILVLALLVSSGENVVVWPWNAAMIVMVVILFWRNAKDGAAGAPRQMLVFRNRFHAFILLLFGILPALSFFGLWDSYLSAALYSGNTGQAVIYVSPAVMKRLPLPALPHVWRRSEPPFLDINRWSYGELNVPLYPEPRIYRRVAEQICILTNNSPDVRLMIKKKPNLLTGTRKSEFYDCEHLGAVD